MIMLYIQLFIQTKQNSSIRMFPLRVISKVENHITTDSTLMKQQRVCMYHCTANYGEKLPTFKEYNWYSANPQMDFLTIDKNDAYFVNQHLQYIRGYYTILIYGYTNSTYSLLAISSRKVTNFLHSLLGSIDKSMSL